jgi:hypothetical protein
LPDIRTLKLKRKKPPGEEDLMHDRELVFSPEKKGRSQKKLASGKESGR